MVFRFGRKADFQLNKYFNSFFTNRKFMLISSWCLGFIFIYASLHKITDPAEFAKSVYGYDLFPHGAINLIAIILPFIELVAGLAIITGFYRRAAVLIIVGMLVTFMVVITINLVRGHQFDCGCFSSSKEVFFVLSGSPLATLIRDFFLLLLCAHILKFNK